jgi:hypothetical protein
VFVSGNLDRSAFSNNVWLGIQSGLQFWPQIEMPPDLSGAHEFGFRVAMPSGVTAGTMILVQADSASQRQFEEQAISPLADVGLFMPHLSNIRVIDSVPIS